MELILKKRFVVTGTGTDRQTVLRITDETPYQDYGINLSTVSVVLKVVSPGGVVVHENTNHNSPDMDENVGFVFETPILPESVDTDLPIEGNYTVVHSVRYRSMVSNVPYEAVPINSNTIRVLTEGLEVVESQPFWIKTLDFNQSPNPNAGIYSIVSSSQPVEGYTDLVLEVYPGGSGASLFGPNFNSYAEFTAIITEAKTDVFEFKFKLPSLSMELESECDLGVLKFTDNTLFPYETESDVRSVKLKYPENTEDEKPDIEFSTAYNVISDLYTGTWNCVLRRDVVFILSVEDYVTIELGLVKAQSHRVDCSESLCSVTECFNTLLARVDDAACNGSGSEHARLVNHMNTITSHIMLAQLLKQCGIEGYREVVDEVGRLFSYAGISGCGCLPNDGISRKVMPIASLLPGGGQVTITSSDGSLTVSLSDQNYDIKVSQQTLDNLQGMDGATIHYSGSAPSPSVGKLGDFLFQSNGNVWEKISSGWVVRFNTIPDVATIHYAPTGPSPNLGNPGDFAFSNNGDVWYKSPQGAWGVAYNLVPNVPPSNYVFYADELPSGPGSDFGNNDDVLILSTPTKSLYKKIGGVWVFQGHLQKFHRGIQDNQEQNPLPPNMSGGNAVLHFVSNHDVEVVTVSGNTYTVNGIQRIDGGTTSAPVDGEEFRVLNVGVEDIVVNLDFGSLLTGGAGPREVTMSGPNTSVNIAPKSTALFKYSPTLDKYLMIT